MDPSEIITAVVAAYAAIVSTVALVFQRRDKRAREETRCEVEVGLYTVVEPVLAQTELQAVRVKLFNRSEHPVRWTGVAFHRQGGGPDEWLVPTAYAWSAQHQLPLEVPSRDARDIMLDRERLEASGMNRSQPVRVRTSLSTGETFYSDEKPLHKGT
ncbi:MAG: hypothetical protein ICV69_05705 [Thermoleophilaceae bacterium]|nr:hypothetical protein [Thermoleophilaceae bacterium]